MTNAILSLANPAVQQLMPYQAGKPISELERELGIHDAIKLASNENPLGCSPAARSAMQAALLESHIYPDAGGHALKNALATHCEVKPDQITLGNGSDNVLELIIKTFLNDHDTAVMSEFTFLTIPLLVKACGAKAIMVPTLNYQQDVSALLTAIQANTRLLFIVNPNNPTGTYLNADDFAQLMKSVPSNVMVVVDEAYHEYMDEPDYPNTVSALRHYPNLIVVRTFSKAHGLAGVRLGYALSSPETADLLNRVRLPFNVNSVATAAGIASLKDRAHIEASKRLNTAGKQQLMEGFKRLQLRFIPSAGNFLTVDVGDAKGVYDALLRRGVIVRPLLPYGLPHHLRITISTEADNNRCLAALSGLKEMLCPSLPLNQ